MDRSAGTARFERFGEYILLRRLAAGGMAEVFVARPARLNANGRVVVLKRILREVANQESFVQMFHSEIQVTLGFSHPNTIQLHDFGEIDGQPYLVMEYLEGRTLRQIWNALLSEKRLLHPATVLELMAQGAAGLAYGHDFENTVTGEHVHAIHRDVSPQNLMVSFNGHLKVIDYGIAKAKNIVGDKTRVGLVKGKCAYLSPEQLQGIQLDGRCDVFCLGIVAWELLTGERLFQRPGDSEMATMQRVLNCEDIVVPPSRLNPEIPKEIDDVILKALRANRDQRFPNASSFQLALARCLRKLYPAYVPANTAEVMRGLFQKELLEDRHQLQQLNARAQSELLAECEAKTVAVPAERGRPSSAHTATFQSGSAIEVQVANIENLLKNQSRMGPRHYAMGAFLVLGVITLKLDQRYSFFDQLLPAPKEAELAKAPPPQAPPAPVKSPLSPQETQRATPIAVAPAPKNPSSAVEKKKVERVPASASKAPRKRASPRESSRIRKPARNR